MANWKHLAVSMLAIVLIACGGSSAPVDPTIYTAFMSNLDNVDEDFVPDQLLRGLSLGLDFDVEQRVEVTALGVFDWEEDGLASEHKVSIYDRDGNEIVSVRILAGEGYLQNGFRYVDLDDPVILPRGFEGTVAVGYHPGNLDRNANTHGDLQIDPPSTFDDGGGRISNVGESRYGLDAESFPDVPDQVHGGGYSARYHAGSFCFRQPQ